MGTAPVKITPEKKETIAMSGVLNLLMIGKTVSIAGAPAALIDSKPPNFLEI